MICASSDRAPGSAPARRWSAGSPSRRSSRAAVRDCASWQGLLVRLNELVRRWKEDRARSLPGVGRDWVMRRRRRFRRARLAEQVERNYLRRRRPSGDRAARSIHPRQISWRSAASVLLTIWSILRAPVSELVQRATICSGHRVGCSRKAIFWLASKRLPDLVELQPAISASASRAADRTARSACAPAGPALNAATCGRWHRDLAVDAFGDCVRLVMMSVARLLVRMMIVF